MFAIVASLSSCKPRYFGTSNEVRAQLLAHEPEYIAAAEKWNLPPERMMFGYFGEGHYRWGEIFIDRTKEGYKVGQGNNSMIVLDLQSAAKRAGTDEHVIQDWIATAQRLKIYAIEKTDVGDGGYIQMDLWGSEWSPYGLRYAPTANQSAYANLTEDLKTNGNHTYDLRLIQLEDRWFYFESKHSPP